MKLIVNLIWFFTLTTSMCAKIFRWSKIASCLPGRTDNEIKNFWNTHIKKRFAPEESKPSRKKHKGVPNPSQSVSCSDVVSITSNTLPNIDCEEDSSIGIFIDLDECLASEDDFKLWPLDNASISSASMDSTCNEMSNEMTNILIDLDECLTSEDVFKLWPLDSVSISSASAGCTFAETSNEKINNILIDLDECLTSEDNFKLWPPDNALISSASANFSLKKKSNILIEPEEFLAAEDYELAGNDCQTSSSMASWQMAMHADNVEDYSQPISSPSGSLCSNVCTANNNEFIMDVKNNIMIELDECLAMSANQFEVLGINDCQISLSSTTLQMDLDNLMQMDEIKDVPIGSEIWSMLDDDGDCNSSAAMALDQVCNSTRGVENKGWLVYLEKELELW